MQATQPQSFKALLALSTHVQATPLTKTHQELIKLRASQLNGCAFCLDMHLKEAMKAGESIQRIVLLDAWKETDLYTEDEKIILALTESVTLISQHGVSDELYKRAEQTFGEVYLAQLLMAIVTINAWNRIAISTQMQLDA